MRTRKKNKQRVIMGELIKAPLFSKEVEMKEFKSDKRITSMLTTSVVVYVLGLIAIGVLTYLQYQRGTQPPTRLVAYGIAVVALIFFGARLVIMLSSAKGAFLTIDGDTVKGTSNLSPKSKKNEEFSINKSEILSVGKVDTQMNTRASFPTVVINTQQRSYRCFAVENVDEIISLLDPHEDSKTNFENENADI